jgi:hypothetical protein
MLKIPDSSEPLRIKKKQVPTITPPVETPETESHKSQITLINTQKGSSLTRNTSGNLNFTSAVKELDKQNAEVPSQTDHPFDTEEMRKAEEKAAK